VIPERVPVDAAPAPAAVAVAVEAVELTESRVADGMRIETRRRGEETEAVLHAAGLQRYSTLELHDPLRFVVDLEGVAASPLNVAVETTLVRGMRVAAFRTTPRVARVVFDLKVPVDAHIERIGDAVRVVLRPRTARASGAEP
jgi:hypothetical protein